MPIRIGNIASGADFFDRKTELEDLWRYVEGNHIALTGPRRLGKSSLLKRLGEQAAEKGLLACFVDLEGLDSAAALIAAINTACPDTSLKNHAKVAAGAISDGMGRLRKIELKLPGGLGGGLELQAPPDAGWAIDAHKLQARLTTQPVLLLIDEFSVFLERLIARDARETEQLLGWLRAWRMSDTVCRFIFSGSIGINTLLERHSLSTWLNDCYEYKLGPFRPSPAQAMLVTLAQREGWQLAAQNAAHLCNKTGWLSPFYLNLLLDEAIKAARDRLLECGDGAHEIRSTDIDDGYDRLLAGRSRFIHWFKRLQRDLATPELEFSLAVLRIAAKATTPLTRRQMLARLAKLEPDPDIRITRLSDCLAYLEEHGYLGESTAGRIDFLSFLLRDYWKRNHAD